MWLPEELDDCRNLLTDVEDIKVRELFSESEIEAIGDKPIAFFNLKNRFIPPPLKASQKLSKVTFQRLWTETFEFDQWLKSIASKVWFDTDTHIQINFSFLCKKPLTGETIYIYAAKPLSPYNFFVDSKKECLDEFSKIPKDQSSLLHKVFVNSQSDNPFSESGYCPYRLVCSYVWIMK